MQNSVEEVDLIPTCVAGLGTRQLACGNRLGIGAEDDDRQRVASKRFLPLRQRLADDDVLIDYREARFEIALCDLLSELIAQVQLGYRFRGQVCGHFSASGNNHASKDVAAQMNALRQLLGQRLCNA